MIVWTLDTKRPIRKWQAHSRVIYAVEVIQGASIYGRADDESLVILSQGRDGQLRVWNANHVLNGSLQNDAIKPIFEVATNALTFCRFSWCFKGIQSMDAAWKAPI